MTEYRLRTLRNVDYSESGRSTIHTMHMAYDTHYAHDTRYTIHEPMHDTRIPTSRCHELSKTATKCPSRFKSSPPLPPRRVLIRLGISTKRHDHKETSHNRQDKTNKPWHCIYCLCLDYSTSTFSTPTWDWQHPDLTTVWLEIPNRSELTGRLFGYVYDWVNFGKWMIGALGWWCHGY